MDAFQFPKYLNLADRRSLAVKMSSSKRRNDGFKLLQYVTKRDVVRFIELGRELLTELGQYREVFFVSRWAISRCRDQLAER